MTRIEVDGLVTGVTRDRPMELEEIQSEFDGKLYRIQGRGLWDGREHFILTALGSHTQPQNMTASRAFGKVLFGKVLLLEVGHDMS